MVRHPQIKESSYSQTPDAWRGRKASQGAGTSPNVFINCLWFLLPIRTEACLALYSQLPSHQTGRTLNKSDSLVLRVVGRMAKVSRSSKVPAKTEADGSPGQLYESCLEVHTRSNTWILLQACPEVKHWVRSWCRSVPPPTL